MLFVIVFCALFCCATLITGYLGIVEWLLNLVYYHIGAAAYHSAKFWAYVINWCLVVAAMCQMIWIMHRLDRGDKIPAVEKIKSMIKSS